ncbi:TIR domain-containing protein [Glycomyces paridis]|uniref:TIR domain-containing protein n=1 Tax=Glycomyces paridis TaxID=2126555 RepID=A0A4S8PJG8_9ACTN|nr:TIR domain-containing protein [Glycomyces paridis]THV30141.1 TIR domain-containing protein [Glycomyces paridis]
MLLKPGLDVIVLCHPGDHGLAARPFERLWEHVHRDRPDAMAGGSVEVYLHSRAWDGESGPPRWLAALERGADRMDEAWFTTVVPVLGPALARAYSQDPVWASAIDHLLAAADGGADRLKVAALQTPTAGIMTSPLWHTVKRRLTLDARSFDDGAVLCREVARVSAQTVYTALGEPDPIKVFVSHAKRDLEPDGIVEVVRDVLRDMHMGEFFDAVSLQPGELLFEGLDEGTEASAMLAVITEHYSQSKSTARELIRAKTENRAIAGVADLAGRVEHRTFATSDFRVAHASSSDLREPVEQALNHLVDRSLEVALDLYKWAALQDALGHAVATTAQPCMVTIDHYRERLAARGATDTPVWVYSGPRAFPDDLAMLHRLSRSPELPQGIRIVHQREINAAETRADAPGVFTPLPEDALEGVCVQLSVSDSFDLERLGLDQRHCRLAVAEIAQAVFAAGGTVVYGGDLREDGFTWLLAEQAAKYGRRGFPVLRVFLAAGVHARLGPDDLARFDAVAGINGETVLLGPSGDTVPQPAPTPLPQQEKAIAMSAARRTMAAASDALVTVGGRYDPVLRPRPGVWEEILHAAASNSPLFLAGGFGGASAAALAAVDTPRPDTGDLHAALRSATVNPGLDAEERAALAGTHRSSLIASLVLKGLLAVKREA